MLFRNSERGCAARSLFAAALIALLMCTPFAQVLAQSSDAQLPPGAARTVAFSEVIQPAQFDGDLHDLPPNWNPRPFHTWNEFEMPMPERSVPPALNAPTGPIPLVINAPMPGPLKNFDGLSFNTAVSGGFAGAGYPPDTNGDVGPTVYIQAVNDAFGIFDKSSGTIIVAFTEDQLWGGAGTGTACDANNQGDPIAIHDAVADRWILSNFAFTSTSVGPFYQCIAVSKTNDPVAGGWWLYAVRTDTGATGGPPNNMFADYPKFGIWSDCVYMGANGFAGGEDFSGPIFAAFDRATLYAGHALTGSNSSIGFISSGNVFGLFPANLQGTGAASMPPNGTPAYFVSQSGTAYAVEVRKFQSAATSCGAGSTLSAPTLVSEASYGYPATGTASNATPNMVRQTNANRLDSLGDELMQRVTYRKVGAAESLWAVHTTCGTGMSADGLCVSTTTPTQPQWVQINVSGGVIHTTPVQQQIYTPDTTTYRWMASVAVDRLGDMAMGYSTSSSTLFPSLAYSGRLVGDVLNQLPQTESTLIAGAGSQGNSCGGPCHRWGDYSSMTIDPVDDCTFWYTSEYYDTAAHGTSGDWHTRIGSFKFTGCKGEQTIAFTSTVPVAPVFAGPTYNVAATASSGLAVTFSTDAASATVCSISGTTVSFIGVGTCTIDANQTGNANFSAAPQASQTFNVGKASQTIAFTSSDNSAVVGGPTYTPAATGGASGNPVTFSIDATSGAGVCSVASAAVSFAGVGSCVIDANQAGNAHYNAATQVHQIVAVGKGNQVVAFTSAGNGATVGGPTYAPTASGGASGNPVTFSIDGVSSPGTCSIAGGVVSFAAVGNCVIDADQAGSSKYNAAAQVQQSIVVGKGSQTIMFNSTPPVDASVGGPTYSVTASASSNLSVSFTIDGASSSVCTLNGSSVTFIATGTCTIDANQAGNSNYLAAAQAQQVVPVAPTPVNHLVFTVQLVDTLAGVPQSVSVSVETAANVVLATDNASVITLSVNACSNQVLDSATVAGGVATFNVRLYSVSTGVQLHAATSSATAADSATFNVLTNVDSIFWNGFEVCTP